MTDVEAPLTRLLGPVLVGARPLLWPSPRFTDVTRAATNQARCPSLNHSRIDGGAPDPGLSSPINFRGLRARGAPHESPPSDTYAGH
jgi:hypothetical protein